MICLTSNVQTLWCDLLVEELVRCGVRCFCLSSGARSGPLASAVARHPGITPVVHFDERASAFFALGHARATGIPSVWMTTSGTALANGFPAVVEAAQDDVPLLLLTADRPPELRDAGANQTIDQVRFFDPYVRWQIDMPCPDTAITPAYVLTTVDQAVARARGPVPGPVHLNAMFREPLTSAADGVDYGDYAKEVKPWMASRNPYCAICPSVRTVEEDTLQRLRLKMESARNGMIAVGRLSTDAERRAVTEWAQGVPWPVLADVTSGIRTGGAAWAACIPYADQVLLVDRPDWDPDVIMHIGGPFVSKRIDQWMHRSKADVVVVKAHTRRQDPAHRAALVVETDLVTFAQASVWYRPAYRRAACLSAWQEASESVAGIMDRFLAEPLPLDEIYVAAEISRQRPAEVGLFLGNSMPIRDMDRYARPGALGDPVAANRGASGIDGTVATACGYAQGLDQPVVVLLGDLACLHDLNALQYARRSKQPVVLIVINNNGGGIFSFLPMAADRAVFETVFGTPHDLTFAHAAGLFELPYVQPDSREAFAESLRQALGEGRSCMIEVRTDRTRNAQVHQELQGRITSRLADGG